MILVTYSHEKDAVVSALKKISESEKYELQFISGLELLNNTEINDEINHGVASIQWKLSGGKIIENTNHVLLINRMFEASPIWFSDFHEEDQLYAQQEFTAYLSFALSAFNNRLSTPHAFGLSGPGWPLPLQWSLAREINIQTPKYRYSSAPAETPAGILIDLYDFDYYLKDNHSSSTSRLSVDPVMGEIVSFISVKHQMFLGTPSNLSEQQLLEASIIAKKISEKLTLGISQINLAHTENGWVFISSSPWFSRTISQDSLVTALKKVIEEAL